LLTVETITTEYQLCTCTSLVWHGWSKLRYVNLCGFGGYQKDSTCESSVVFTLDVFWFLSRHRVIANFVFCESSVVFTLDVFWFLSQHRVISNFVFCESSVVFTLDVFWFLSRHRVISNFVY